MSLAEVQSYLRQKKATGRLSPEEMETAYKAYFAAESSNSIASATQDLEAERVAIAERQADERLANAATAIKNAENAAEISGRVQIAKMAVPDLFMFRGDGDNGGAQSATTGAVSSLGTTSESDNGTSTGTTGTIGGLLGDLGSTISDAAVSGSKGAVTGALATSVMGTGPIPGAITGFVSGAAKSLAPQVSAWIDDVYSTVKDMIFGIEIDDAFSFSDLEAEAFGTTSTGGYSTDSMDAAMSQSDAQAAENDAQSGIGDSSSGMGDMGGFGGLGIGNPGSYGGGDSGSSSSGGSDGNAGSSSGDSGDSE